MNRPRWPLIVVLAAAIGSTAAGCATWPNRGASQAPPAGASPTPPVRARISDQTPAVQDTDSSSDEKTVIRGQSPGDDAGAGSYGGYGAPGTNGAAGGYGTNNGYGAAGTNTVGPNGYGSNGANSTTPGSNGQSRYPQAVSGGAPQTTFFQPPPVNGAPATGATGGVAPYGSGYAVPAAAPAYGSGVGTAVGAAPGVAPAVNPGWTLPGAAPAPYGATGLPLTESLTQPPSNSADLIARVTETQTGRFQFGVGVNSDAGVTGQIVVDERNFDWTRLPTSWSDWVNGTAFRGAGQGFRMEAMPGNQVQRYLVSFTEPYLFGWSPISLNLSGFYYDRRFYDWDESRLGGRVALGYRLSPDMSLSGAIRAEQVDISNPRVTGVQELDEAVGVNELYSGRITLTHDTRDMPFFPTEGHYIELAFEQAFGTFDYPRAEIDYRKYFLIRERPDGSGRHTFSVGLRVGFSGTDTPIYENYFAGGFSTLRGFDFRGASPVNGGVVVGGPFKFLGSAEYFFPLTADDMIKGVVFCDFGTVETEIQMQPENFRVAPGFGLRLNIPALGPAPLALDFAVPVTHASTDNIQNFSFFFGFGR